MTDHDKDIDEFWREQAALEKLGQDEDADELKRAAALIEAAKDCEIPVLASTTAGAIVKSYKITEASSSREWLWFAHKLTYANYLVKNTDEPSAAEATAQAIRDFWVSSETSLEEKRSGLTLADRYIGVTVTGLALVKIGCFDIGDIMDSNRFNHLLEELKTEDDFKQQALAQSRALREFMRPLVRAVCTSWLAEVHDDFGRLAATMDSAARSIADLMLARAAHGNIPPMGVADTQEEIYRGPHVPLPQYNIDPMIFQ